VDLATLSGTEVSSATRAGCPTCSVADGPTEAVPSKAAMFEAGVAVPPKAFLDLKAHQMHYKPSNLALQQRFKSWPVAPRVALPEPAYAQLAHAPGTEQPPPGRGSPVTAQSLSLLLEMAAGVRGSDDDRVQRWTASGGNIGSVTAYVVVRDCPELRAGRYAYVAPDHDLAWLGGDLSGVPGSAPVTLVLTGDYAKVAQKYSAFALRIVLLDSGCAQATTRLVAEALGVRLSSCPRWDDEALSAALQIDPDVEPVTAVMELGGRP
jgi:SagB-type dehydrogenase family enzyme